MQFEVGGSGKPIATRGRSVRLKQPGSRLGAAATPINRNLCEPAPGTAPANGVLVQGGNGGLTGGKSGTSKRPYPRYRCVGASKNTTGWVSDIAFHPTFGVPWSAPAGQRNPSAEDRMVVPVKASPTAALNRPDDGTPGAVSRKTAMSRPR